MKTRIVHREDVRLIRTRKGHERELTLVRQKKKIRKRNNRNGTQDARAPREKVVGPSRSGSQI